MRTYVRTCVNACVCVCVDYFCRSTCFPATELCARRRRGGIEPLHVSMPHELKSCPSTSPTHLGLAEKFKWAPEYAYRRALPSLVSACDVAHHTRTSNLHGQLYSLWGSNPRPMAHKTIALTTELRERCTERRRSVDYHGIRCNCCMSSLRGT